MAKTKQIGVRSNELRANRISVHYYAKNGRQVPDWLLCSFYHDPLRA